MHSQVKLFIIFLLTYGGMAAGRLPWLQIDRTGIALVGLIAILGSEALTLDEIGSRVDMATLVLLFALMIITAQFIASGFCDRMYSRLAAVGGSPKRLLALTVATTGGLATFLANDTLVFATTPILIDALRARSLNPRPYILAMIAAANAGSAATIIGSPQTIIIGQWGGLRLPTYLMACGIPALVALYLVYAVISWVWRNRLEQPIDGFKETPPPPVVLRPHDLRQTRKGVVALLGLLTLFSTGLPKDVYALPLAAFLLLNRRYTSRALIGGVDWPLLLLVTCLFAVTGGLGWTTLPAKVTETLGSLALAPDNLMVLAPLSLIMSCTIGNVPFTILLLQLYPDAETGTLYGLALFSSLAGNFLAISSLSNLIIVERARDHGVKLVFSEFIQVGIPITILSMAFAVFWLWITGFMPLMSV